MIRKDYKYLAGIIDGEGCISLSKPSPSKDMTDYGLKITVVNTSIDLINWLQDNFGGFYYSEQRNEKWKPVWIWVIGYQRAANLLKKILPHLIVKKEQAEIAIAFQKTKKFRGKRVSENILNKRKTFYAQMKQLNKKGLK